MSVTRFLLSVPLMAALGCATTESAAPAAAKPPAPSRPTVPAEVEVPASATLVLQLLAKGTQNYRCQATSAERGGVEAGGSRSRALPGGRAGRRPRRHPRRRAVMDAQGRQRRQG
jgi:hypothetical protein